MTLEEIQNKIDEHEIKFNLLISSFNLDTIFLDDTIRQLQKINYHLQYLKTLKEKELWKMK